MTWRVLLVELETQDYAENWAEVFAPDENAGFEFAYATNVEDAKVAMTEGNVFCVIHLAMDDSQDLSDLVRYHIAMMGPLPDHQIIICDDPSAYFLAAVYEYGIEQFFMHSSAVEDLKPVLSNLLSLVNDSKSVEFRIIAYQAALRSGLKDRIVIAAEALGDLADYDYRVAYMQGKVCEYTGDIEVAVKHYRSASMMQKMFRPAQTSLGENLLLMGEIDESISIFEKLDRTNPNDLERKTQIAEAYVEKNDLKIANEYCDAIFEIDPESSKIPEIKAHIFLSQGKLGEAFKLMDKMENVGPFFAAKLNDFGIKLAQGGHVKNALALYQKAHKIVRSELRYKISMNASLACRKMQNYDLAIKYAHRCEKEYGSEFPKLAKIKQTLNAEKAQLKTAPAPEKKAG